MLAAWLILLGMDDQDPVTVVKISEGSADLGSASLR
jgi:hypothetical protein